MTAVRVGAWARRVWVAVLVCLVVAVPSPALAYLKFGYDVNGTPFTLKWTKTPVRYYVTAASVSGVSATQMQEAVGRAFATWQAVPTASISYEFGGFTRDLPGEDDGRSTLGFLEQPDLDRVLASTSFLIDDATGELIESDIFFNSAFPWSVASAGERGRWDLQSIALHEIGHMSGLGHSAIGETDIAATGGRRVISTGSAMFPIAVGSGDITGRTLQADDIAGISDLYPDNGFNSKTGSLSGTVRKDGHGVYGAHVVAVNLSTGAQVANFTLNRAGAFSIAGLKPGPHLVRVEPLDDADTESFFDLSMPTDVDFAPMFYERLVVVPRGGDSGLVSLEVNWP